MTKSTIHQTRTGSFPIGFRKGFSEWQKDLSSVLNWAKDNHFSLVDIGRDADSSAALVRQAGLSIGSADLLVWQDMISPDAGKRRDAVAKNSDYIQAATRGGALNFFTVMLPEKPELPRIENFAFMVESFAQLAPVLDATGSKIVIEGWPGNGALCCTPEGYRAFLKEMTGGSMGINYDPSHLVRMGIDPLRFLREFISHVYHVHGKDTLLFPDALYEFGNLQPATFAMGRRFGDQVWRYTIPGHGIISWVEIFGLLKEASYQGAVSIELEDENFNGSIEGEKEGLLQSASYLSGV